MQKLASYDGSLHDRGRSKLIYAVWVVVSILFLRNPFLPIAKIKRFLLIAFGAQIGRGVVIKPAVHIRYPWKLRIGNDCWIGERVWIENLANVTIGNNVCISQDAMILSGSHDYARTTFDDNSAPIILEDGVWVGARAVVGHGVTIGRNTVLGMNSVAQKDLKSDSVFIGHPARRASAREFRTESTELQ